MYLGQSAIGGFGPWRAAIDKVEALLPGTSCAATRTGGLTTTRSGRSTRPGSTSTTRTSSCAIENTAVGYFNAKIERYPDYLGQLILWVTARALYGVREHPGKDAGRIVLSSWL